MGKIRKPSMMTPTLRAFFNPTLHQIGLKGTAAGMRGTVGGCRCHRLMLWGVQELLGIWNGLIFEQEHGYEYCIKKGALGKREREAAQGIRSLRK